MLGKQGCLCRRNFPGSEVAVAKKQDLSDKKTKSAPRAKAKPSKADNAGAASAGTAEENKRAASAEAAKPRGISEELIGQTAGDVWRVLAERGGQSLAGLKKSLDASDDLVMLAVGWLAREDKLAFETNGRTFSVSLK